MISREPKLGHSYGQSLKLLDLSRFPNTALNDCKADTEVIVSSGAWPSVNGSRIRILAP